MFWGVFYAFCGSEMYSDEFPVLFFYSKSYFFSVAHDWLTWKSFLHMMMIYPSKLAHDHYVIRPWALQIVREVS